MEDVSYSLMWSPVSSAVADVGDEQVSPTIRVGPETLPEMNARRNMYPKQQWLALKPIIKQLYINEGQTFSKVAEYLRAHYSFSPTKKQFTRRISEWGFEKNVKQRERRAIIEALSAETNTGRFEARVLRGRRLDKAKIERWKRKEGIGCGPCGGSQTGYAEPSGMSYGTSSLNGGPLLSLEMEFCSQDDTPEEIVHHGEQLESKPIEQESTFNPWLVVDIVGSPDLTRLIGALTIDLCEEIPGLDLSTESSEESQEACKLMNPYKGCSSTITYKAQGQLSPLKTTPPSVPFSIAAFSIYSSKQSWHRMPGPLDELYLFPSPTQSKRLLETPRTDHLVSGYSLNMKELECRTRVKALKSMNRSEIIKLVNEMRSIAWRYYEIERFGSAETWWRRVVTSCMEIPGYEPIKVLQACLYVVNNARLQGRYEEALGLFQPIYQKTMTLIGPDHELAMLSKFILAGLWDELGEKELGMATVRDLLQISLLRFGTRSRETLRALISLGYSLCSFGQYREAEAIFSICVELNCEICHYADRDTIDIHNGIESRTALARVLNQQRRYEDCKTLLQTTNGYFMDLIRVEKPSCWEYFHQKARVLKYEGRLRESEEILRAILKHAPNYPDFTITLTMMELAEVLMESGQEEEVITWWESIFSMTVKLFGIEHRISRYRSMKLGFSYADRGRFDDAILHFQQDMEKLAPSDLDDPGSRDDYIQDLHCWIDEVVWMKRKMKMGEMMEV